MINNKNIIFIHTQGSNRSINIDNIIKKYINDSDTILICANKNLYPENNINYKLADIFVNIKIINYIDIIKNSNEIHVINSCFSCIVYPLNIMKKLKTTSVIIYDG